VARSHAFQRSLSDNSQHLNCGGGDRQRGHPSQETLAEMIGTTRFAGKLFHERVPQKRFHDYNGTIEVHRSIDAVLRDGFASFVIAG